MKLKEVKNYISETIYKRDKDFANVVFYLIKNGFTGKALHQIDEADIIMMYDNLWINCEIVNSENISDYDEEHLTKKAGKIRVNKIKRDAGLFLVLNYYDANANRKNSCFVFTYGYNAII